MEHEVSGSARGFGHLQQGLAVSARGRISAEVLEAYKARDEKPAVVPVAEAPAVKKTRGRAKAKQSEFSSAQ